MQEMQIPKMITVTTVNANCEQKDYDWICFAHFRHDWMNNLPMPSIHDNVIQANVYNQELKSGTFNDIVKILKDKFEW